MDGERMPDRDSVASVESGCVEAGRRKGRCGWQCVGDIRHSLRLEGVGSELVEGV